MKVSVVTPNYNGMKFLKSYLDSLNNDLEAIGEVILVDNGSNDGSQEFIKNYSKTSKFPIILIENKENMGFAEPINQAIEKANYDYIFSLNNDTNLEKEAITKSLKVIQSNKEIFSVASKMIQFNNKELIDDAGDEYNLLAWTKKTGDGQPASKYSENREIFSSCAGASLYRKDVLKELGGFDKNFFAYMEDVDLSLRALINGYRNIYCAESIVYHIGSGTSGSRYNEFKVRLAARNNVWTVYKNLPVPQKILNIGFLTIGFLIKYIFFIKKGFGPIYLSGLKEGIKTKNKVKKVNFKSENTKNYFKIEWKLIKNTINFLRK